MLQRRILLVQENIQSARSTRQLLEEAGYLVVWRPTVTPALLRTEAPSDAVLFDLHSLDDEELASFHSLRAHPRWRAAPTLVMVGKFDRDTRSLQRRMQADEVVAKPIGSSELLLRVQALFRTARTEEPTEGQEPRKVLRPASIHNLAHLAADYSSLEAVEAILIQVLRSLRREVPFDVGFVCVEASPERYSLVAQTGDERCHPPRWYGLGESYTGWIALHKRPLMIPSVSKDPGVELPDAELLATHKLLSFFGIPVMYGERVVGTLELGSYRTGAWSERVIEAVQVAGRIASIALRSPQVRHGLSMEVSRQLPAEPDEQQRPPIICRSSAMQDVLRIAARVRESSVPVLITGESGSGKDVMAQYLHGAAARRQQPFIAVLCAAVPEMFQLREMFGVDKAVAPGGEGRVGRFEECGHGTLFLDEVGRMSLTLQAKLLRVLEERRFSRIGASQSQPFLGRVIAATSLNLQAAMEAGQFLPELYYRLAVIELRIPPLQARREDIGPLAQHFAEHFCRKYKLPPHRFSAEVLQELAKRPWPGNIRELSNVVERSLLLFDGTLVDAPIQDGGEHSGNDLLEKIVGQQWSVPDLQLRYSRYVYERVGRNKAHACRVLQINYRTLCHYLASATSSSPQAPRVH